MKKNNAFFLILIIALGIFSFLPASAAGLVSCGRSGDSPCTLCDLLVLIKSLIDFGTRLLIIVALGGITIAGVMYIIAGGSPGMVTQAKSLMKNSLIGFAIFLGAWLMISIVMNLLSAKTNLGIQQANNWYTFDCTRRDTEGNVIPPQ